MRPSTKLSGSDPGFTQPPIICRASFASAAAAVTPTELLTQRDDGSAHQSARGAGALRTYRVVENWDNDMLATADALLALADQNDIVALDTADLALAISGLSYRCLFYGALVRLLAEGVVEFVRNGIGVARVRERLAVDDELGAGMPSVECIEMQLAA